jgi:tyrosyl-tRNA synthetase
VHSEKDCNSAIAASEVLFGKGTTESLKEFTEETLLDLFSGVPQSEISKSELQKGIIMVDFLSEITNVLPSKGEARRSIKGGGISINKEKVMDENATVTPKDLLNGKYILVQRGKKNYHLVSVK